MTSLSAIVVPVFLDTDTESTHLVRQMGSSPYTCPQYPLQRPVMAVDKNQHFLPHCLDDFADTTLYNLLVPVKLVRVRPHEPCYTSGIETFHPGTVE